MSSNPRGETVVRFTIVLAVIDTLAVILRLLSRQKTKAGFGIDDWLIVVSLCPVYSMIVVSTLMVHQGGLGKHLATLTPSEMVSLLKLIIPAMITYGFTITCAKISILLLYRRIFDCLRIRRATVVIGALSIGWLFTVVFSEIFLCSPTSAAWDPALIFTNRCGDYEALLLGVTISNIILDVIVLILPLPIIWGLQLSKRKRVMVSGLFLLGSFTCIISILRATSIGNIRNEDFPYTLLMAYIWSHVEPATAIWCACIMTYRPLIVGLKNSLQSSFNKKDQSLQKDTSSASESKPTSHESNNCTATQWPNGQGLGSQELLTYPNLNRKATNNEVHIIRTYLHHHQDPDLEKDDYECAATTVSHKASLAAE